MKEKTARILLVAILGLMVISIGIFIGINNFNQHGKQVQKVETENTSQTSSSRSEQTPQDSKITVNEKQIDYLKNHEQDIANFIEKQNPKVINIQLNYNSVEIDSNEGIFEDNGYILSISGGFNNIKDSDFSMSFLLDNSADTPNMNSIENLTPTLRVLKNGVWDIYK